MITLSAVVMLLALIGLVIMGLIHNKSKPIEVWELHYKLKGASEPVVFRYPVAEHYVCSAAYAQMRKDGNCEALEMRKTKFKPPRK